MGMLRKIKRRQQKRQSSNQLLLADVAFQLSRPEGREVFEPWMFEAAEAEGLTAEQTRRGIDAIARLVDEEALTQMLAEGEFFGDYVYWQLREAAHEEDETSDAPNSVTRKLIALLFQTAQAVQTGELPRPARQSALA